MRKLTKELPFNQWPARLRAEWELAFAKGDFLDEDGPGAHLRPATRAMLQSALGRFFRFLQSSRRLESFQLDSYQLNPDLLSIYVDARRSTCCERSIAIELRQIRSALLLLFPGLDLTWLLNAAKRIEANAPAKKQMLHLVTSDRLYLIGLKLMDQAVQDSRELGLVSKRSAFEYRDGLMILLLSLIPLRRRTLTALRVGKHLIRSGKLWALDIPAEDTKSNMSMEFLLCETLSRRTDLYLGEFRPRIPNAARHSGLWVSNKSNPMDDGTIYDMVRRRTKAELGFGVSLHRFRHAALTFWSIQDPKSIRAGKDLLGHRSFGTTEKFYIMAQSRTAGRVLAAAWKQHLSS